MADIDKSTQSDDHNPDQNAGHQHDYKITLAEVFARRPVFYCKECNKKLKPARSMDILNQVLFYIFLAFALFTADFGPIAGRKSEDILIYVAKVAVAFVIYLLLRYLTARFGPMEVIKEKELTAEELAEQLEKKDAYEKELAAIDQEKQALIEMYRSYEDSENSSDSSGISEMSGINGAAESVVGEVSNQISQTAGAGTAHTQVSTAKAGHSQAAECKHEVKMHWKNFIPGRRIFYCKHCGHPMKMSKKQSNIVNGVFFAGFVIFLLGDTMDLSVPWRDIILKALILLVIVTIVQTIILYVYPFRANDSRGDEASQN